MTAYAEYNFIAYSTKTVLTTSFTPYVALPGLTPTFLGRLENALLHYVDYLYYSYVVFPELDRIVSSSFKNLPPLLELAQRSVLTMFNYDAAVDGILKLKQIYNFDIKHVSNLRCTTTAAKCYWCWRFTNRRT